MISAPLWTRALLLASAVPLAGCVGTPPPSHSPHYTRVPLITPKGRVKKVTVAEACLRADLSDPELLGRTLPPGCANAHNLQLMVEDERDLHRGRRMGNAPAAPTVRAAQKYLYGEQDSPYGGAIVETGQRPTPDAPSSSTPAAQRSQ